MDAINFRIKDNLLVHASKCRLEGIHKNKINGSCLLYAIVSEEIVFTSSPVEYNTLGEQAPAGYHYA